MNPNELEKIQKAAQAVAMAIATELKPPYPMDKILDLEDSPPIRGKPHFQQHDYQDAPKAQIIEQMGDQYVEGRVFCTVDRIYVSTSNVDIDHATAYETITQRQKEFLAFLNKTPEFAEAFLKIKLGDTHMSDFFKNDSSHSNEIKGTKYFYKCSYNAIDNLWLISHGENTSKGKKDFMAWADDKKLDIEMAVQENGGKQRGVFIDVILEKGKDAIAEINGQEIYAGMGLGKFIRQWVAEKYKESFALHKAFYLQGFSVLDKELAEVRSLNLAGKTEEAHDALKEVTKHVHMGLSALSAPLERHSDSEPDSDGSGEVRDVLTIHHVEAADEETHISKEIKAFIRNKDPADEHGLRQNLNGMIVKYSAVLTKSDIGVLYDCIDFPNISLADIQSEFAFFDNTYKEIAKLHSELDELELKQQTDHKKNNPDNAGSSSTTLMSDDAAEKLKKAEQEIEKLYARINALKAGQRQRAANRREAMRQAPAEAPPLPTSMPEIHFAEGEASQKHPLEDDKKSSDTTTIGSNSKRQRSEI